MKLCKCGMPIYDAPDEPYGWKSDKCYACWVKSLNEVDRRLFTSSRIYDKENKMKDGYYWALSIIEEEVSEEENWEVVEVWRGSKIEVSRIGSEVSCSVDDFIFGDRIERNIKDKPNVIGNAEK